jgi:large subunit ribosomal protein L13
MKTYLAKPGEVEAGWYIVDATDKVLGRLAVKVAMTLMGKHRPTYTPHVDTGEFVVVINAEKIRLTGNKWADKQYQWYTGHPGGQKTVTAEHVRDTHPDRIIRDAIRRMLPKTRMGRNMLKKLKVYAGAEHPHQAQQPKELKM